MAKWDIEELERHGYIGTKTNAVYDVEFTRLLSQLPWAQWFEKDSPLRCRAEYLDFYPEWIASSHLNSIEGLQAFPHRHLINGTTQSFDEAYYRYAGKRLRLFRGEYAYHRRVFADWKFIEDEPLAADDFVIVSAPFCTTGDVHPEFYQLLDSATHLKIPVLIDCAYFGTCENFKVKVDFPCVESVSFSLTKGVGLGDIRSGIRFSHFDDNFPIAQQNRYEHTILGAAKIGLYMMQNLSPDFIPNKYSDIQKQVCAELGLTPTKCMHLALGDGSKKWDHYGIDGKYQRVGIRNLIKARFKNLI